MIRLRDFFKRNKTVLQTEQKISSNEGIKYAYILLSSNSVSFCHYTNNNDYKLMPLEVLTRGLIFCSENKIDVIIVYPNETIPNEYTEVINKYKHTSVCDITEAGKCQDSYDALVINNFDDLKHISIYHSKKYILRTTKELLFAHWQKIPINISSKLEIVLTDVQSFSKEDLLQHHCIMANLADKCTNNYKNDSNLPINTLTKRIFLNQMNNCDAINKHITLAPDGNWYVCPGFYFSQMKPIGSLENPIDIKNKHLYEIKYAPICRNCDAFQCKRCIWLNKLTTLEVNTPSHEQCVIAHNERNASRQLLIQLQENGVLLDKNIKEIHYLDPFEVRSQWI